MPKSVNVAKFIRVDKPDDLKGGIKATATTKEVIVTVRVSAIPEGGGSIILHLPWGKIYGVAKNAKATGK